MFQLCVKSNHDEFEKNERGGIKGSQRAAKAISFPGSPLTKEAGKGDPGNEIAAQLKTLALHACTSSSRRLFQLFRFHPRYLIVPYTRLLEFKGTTTLENMP